MFSTYIFQFFFRSSPSSIWLYLLFIFCITNYAPHCLRMIPKLYNKMYQP